MGIFGALHGLGHRKDRPLDWLEGDTLLARDRPNSFYELLVAVAWVKLDESSLQRLVLGEIARDVLGDPGLPRPRGPSEDDLSPSGRGVERGQELLELVGVPQGPDANPVEGQLGRRCLALFGYDEPLKDEERRRRVAQRPTDLLGIGIAREHEVLKRPGGLELFEALEANEESGVCLDEVVGDLRIRHGV